MFHKKHHDNQQASCLKCQYNQLMKEGKVIFDQWDKIAKPPKQLLVIQKQLLKIKKLIQNKPEQFGLKFCADHPDIFEFIPIEWT